MEQSKNMTIKKTIQKKYGNRYELKNLYFIKYFYIAEYFDIKDKKTWYQILRMQGVNILMSPSMFLSFYEALNFEVNKNKVIEYKK